MQGSHFFDDTLAALHSGSQIGRCYSLGKNLTFLQLRRIGEFPRSWPASPPATTISTRLGGGIFVLGCLVEHLHQLIELNITALANGKRPREVKGTSKGTSKPFRKLKFLRFDPDSFVNWRLTGLKEVETTRYIVVLLLRGDLGGMGGGYVVVVVWGGSNLAEWEISM